MNPEITIFRYRFYLREIVLLFFGYLIIEDICGWLFIPKSAITSMYEKLLSILIYFFLFFQFRYLKNEEKIYIGLFTLLMIKLVFESVVDYDSFFQQFTIFTVIYPVVFTIFVRRMLRALDIDLLEFVARFYLYLYIVFMAIYGHGFRFDLELVEMEDYGPFSGDTRVIHARSIYMMIIPFLWYLHKFMTTGRSRVLIPLLFCLVVIVLHQHRSVWISTIVSTGLFLLLKVRSDARSLGPVLQMVMLAAAFSLLTLFFISTLNPDMVTFFSDRFAEILNPAAEDGTGNFRIEQSEIYGDYIKERPLFGWSFEGFTLSNPMVDWWDENTGHHFHQGFIEILFYHGVFGLLLKYSFLLIILWKAFTRRLSPESVILCSFCLSGLVFSLSYTLPLVFWGHVGMCLFYLEYKKQDDDLHRDTGLQPD